jgi:hypothetical protein
MEWDTEYFDFYSFFEKQLYFFLLVKIFETHNFQNLALKYLKLGFKPLKMLTCTLKVMEYIITKKIYTDTPEPKVDL